MKIFYDTEFIEDGKTIDLISIGMVAEDGREYYAVHKQAPWPRIKKSDWLMANVVPHLPQPGGDRRRQVPRSWIVDFDDPRVKIKAQIAVEVATFILATPDVELWAWYGAYDHVVLAQLFGRMIDLPVGIPMWTNDLRQECQRLGDPDIPPQPEGEHNALADARFNRVRWEFLANLAKEPNDVG